MSVFSVLLSTVGFSRAIKDAQHLAVDFHRVMRDLKHSDKYPVSLVKRDTLQFLRDLKNLQLDTIKGLEDVAKKLKTQRETILREVRITRYHQPHEYERFAHYLGQRIIAINAETITFRTLLRDAEKRREARKRDRVRGFLKSHFAEAKEIMIEKKAAKKVSRDYKELNKSIAHFSKAVRKGNLKTIKKEFNAMRSHLDDEIIFDSKHLFLITIDMAFEVKEELSKHKSLRPLVRKLEQQERRVRRAA